jgi:hypothetical protein
LLDKLKDPVLRYAEQARAEGWSRTTLPGLLTHRCAFFDG